MKHYIFLNNTVKELLESELVTSNHVSIKWNILLGQLSFLTFSSDEDILSINPIDLCEHVHLGHYLIELNDSIKDHIISEIPYLSYQSLTREFESHDLETVRPLFDRCKNLTEYSHLNAIFTNKVSKDMIKTVYRRNATVPYWVPCTIQGDKLIHKL